MIADLKPYPEYKESGLAWLGRVPSTWRVVRNGSPFGQRNQTGYQQLPILEVSLKTGVRVRDFENSARKQVMSDIGKYKRAVKGDVAYNMMRMWQGAVGVAPVDGLVSPAYVVARPYPYIEPRFFVALFRTGDYMSEIDSCSRGIVKDRNRLYWDQFKQILSPCPPPAEQAAIVRFLDWANGRLERAKRKVIALLGEQKQAIIHRAVTRGLDPSVSLKPSGIPWLGDIPQHWEAPRVKHCARKISKGTTPSTEGREILESGPVRFLKAENISAGRITEKPLCFIDEETNRMIRRSQLAENDILFVIAGATLGKTAVVSVEVLPANTNQAVAFIRPNSRVVPSFLELWLQSPRIKGLIWLNAVQSAQPNLSMADLGNFATPVPPRNEQEQILEFVKSATKPMSEAISRFEREIELLREYRTRLVADVVTGKLDVRDAARQLPAADVEREVVLDTEELSEPELEEIEP